MRNKSFEILFERLNFSNKNGLFLYENIDEWKNLFPFRTIRTITEIKPYAIFANNNESGITPLIAFIDNNNEINIGNLHPKLWHFQIPVLIIDNGNEYQIYNGQLLNKNRELEQLIKPVNYERLSGNKSINILSFWNLQSGNIWKELGNKFVENKRKKKLYTYLLENIEETIKLLTSNDSDYLIKANDNREIANNLIGRLIFVRYLIDRKVKLNYKFINDDNAQKDFEDLILDRDKLYDFFSFLKSKDKFNGNLFPFYGAKKTGNDYSIEKSLINDKHLKVLHELFLGEKIKELESKQLSFNSLFDIYNFNIIPVELISNIYERFIGKEGQKANNSFYTPPFLVDYVLKYTIEPHLDNNNTCKVLDPSCGSGIFLVETLRKIIEKNIQNGVLLTFKQLQNKAISEQKDLSILIKENDKKLRRLVTDNIFGIDKDPKAITIAIFSIYITILDYKEPKEIESFKFPELIDTNFFIENFFAPTIEDRLLNNSNLEGSLDFIIGNPPWSSVTDDAYHNIFIKDNKEIISDKQIAQSFVINSKNYCSENTKCALIVTSKLLYNIKANKFREFFINNYTLNRVLELSSVRKQIFNGGIAPASILFYQYPIKNDSLNNIVHYISLKPNKFFELFKAIVIEKYDYKKIHQKQLKNDWSWKVLLYGNQLDYSFFDYYFNREDLMLVKDFVDKNELLFGTGYKVAQQSAKDSVNELKHKLVVKGDFLQSFFIYKDGLISFEEEYPNIQLVDGKGVIEVYKAPHLLIKRGIKKKSVIAFADFVCAFPNTVFGLYSKKDDTKILKALGILFSSSLFSYLMLFKSSQWGVERNEVQKNTYENIPIIDLSENIINKLSILYDNINESAKSNFKILKRKQGLEELATGKGKEIKKVLIQYKKLVNSEPRYNFDKEIYELFNIDKEEESLIDYALNVTIPLFDNEKTPFSTLNRNSKILEEYINVFIEQNKNFAKRINHYFCAEVFFDKNNYITINFKFEEKKPKELISFKDNSDNNFSIKNIINSPENISTNIFIQKDIKGINKKSFYVVKPNEFKNWHPAIAYLDYYEFKQALLKAGKGKYNKISNN